MCKCSPTFHGHLRNVGIHSKRHTIIQDNTKYHIKIINVILQSQDQTAVQNCLQFNYLTPNKFFFPKKQKRVQNSSDTLFLQFGLLPPQYSYIRCPSSTSTSLWLSQSEMLLMCVTRALTNSQLYSEGDSLQAANVHCLLIDLSIDWTVPLLLSCSQQQRRLCFSYRTYKFLNPSFNLRSFRFSEFHACTRRREKAIVLNYGLRGSRPWKEVPRMIEIRAAEIFCLFLLFILPRSHFWIKSTILRLENACSKETYCEENCVKIGREQECTLLN